MHPTSPYFFYASLSVLVLSSFSQWRGAKKWPLALLFLGALLLALSSIYKDDYLHPWDERFHALVALNAMENPFHPLLLKDNLMNPWPYHEWYAAHTWLHKQPLFTWQMALGMKVFGTSLAGMRSASVLMYLLMGFAIYRACLFYTKDGAYWATLLSFLQPFLLFLVNGRQGIDHNDMAFVAWVAVSFFGVVGYIKERHIKWVVLLGLASGLAILTKWLAGSLGLGVLGLHLLLTKDFNRKSLGHLLLAILLAAAVFLPWQLYAYQQFPELFMREWRYNSQHIFNAIEGHDHPWDFHFQVWKEKLPLLLFAFVLSSLLIFRRSYEHRKLIQSIFISTLVVMGFYAFAKTKMPAFTIILLPMVAFMVAMLIGSLLKFPRSAVLLLFGFSILGLIQNFWRIDEHSPQVINDQLAFKEFFLSIKEDLPENAVIFNSPSMKFVDIAFYTQRLTYERIPSKETLQKLEEKGLVAYILANENTTIQPHIKAQCQIIKAPSAVIP